MTAPLADLTDDRFTAEQRAKLAEFDAAPTPPEVVVETVARAMAASDGNDWDVTILRSYYRRLAAAAIAALPPSPAELALRELAELVRAADQNAVLIRRSDLRHILNRAALASPAPACSECGIVPEPGFRVAGCSLSSRCPLGPTDPPAPAPQGEEPTDCGCGVRGCVWGHGA